MRLSKEYQYQILCEDAQMKAFVLAFLSDQGINPHRITVGKYPCGEGCGEAYVKSELPREIKILRAKGYMKRALIVCTDADILSVEERIQSLEKQIVSEKIPWNRIHEPIVFWIPKRQIETWIHFLRGDSVDEKMTFPHSGMPISCKGEAKVFSQFCSDIKEIEINELKSLQTAKEEYIRVCRLQ